MLRKEIAMTSEQFIFSFWRQYIMIEKEYLQSEQYVRIDPQNYKTFSDFYAKLLVQIGSEVDVTMKNLCQIKNPSFSGSNIDNYRNALISDNDFLSTKVQVINRNIVLEPWSQWKKQNAVNPHPYWWTIYNKVKHERINIVTVDNITQESYKFANLENTIYALAGLYQAAVYSYYLLSNRENNRTNIPLPGSRLFKLSEGIWTNMYFPYDFDLHVEDGMLIMERSDFTY